ncbi:MAG: hypothetical protein ABR600_08790 [Actinomycetota bacterium]
MSSSQTDDARRWTGDVPAHGDVDEFRMWVVWGVGRPPDDEEGIDVTSTETGHELAEVIAEQHDEEWGERDDGWVVFVEADEDQVDEFVLDNDSVHGYAPYLIEADTTTGAVPAGMEGVLRGDHVKRRPFGAGRPS